MKIIQLKALITEENTPHKSKHSNKELLQSSLPIKLLGSGRSHDSVEFPLSRPHTLKEHRIKALLRREALCTYVHQSFRHGLGPEQEIIDKKGTRNKGQRKGCHQNQYNIIIQ